MHFYRENKTRVFQFVVWYHHFILYDNIIHNNVVLRQKYGFNNIAVAYYVDVFFYT